MQTLSLTSFHRFAHLLPPVITVTLPHGQAFTGYYSPEIKSVGWRFFQEGDVVVLTYHGDGKFKAIIFGPDTVEKSFHMGINIYALIYALLFN